MSVENFIDTKHRTVLLDLYTSLHQTLDKGAKSIDAGLRAAEKNIAAEKFLLAIVGEVKAGKSTFINALLGEAILPYDALQATSEIVEIETRYIAQARKIIDEYVAMFGEITPAEEN